MFNSSHPQLQGQETPGIPNPTFGVLPLLSALIVDVVFVLLF
jgi:hypothetical protein